MLFLNIALLIYLIGAMNVTSDGFCCKCNKVFDSLYLVLAFVNNIYFILFVITMGLDEFC